MTITCDCSCDHGEYPEFYSEKIVKAKKEHKCCECREIIPKGQKYHRASGKWDGEMRSYKTCLPCMRIRDDYCKYGFVFGELPEAFFNCKGFDYREVPTEDEN